MLTSIDILQKINLFKHDLLKNNIIINGVMEIYGYLHPPYINLALDNIVHDYITHSNCNTYYFNLSIILYIMLCCTGMHALHTFVHGQELYLFYHVKIVLFRLRLFVFLQCTTLHVNVLKIIVLLLKTFFIYTLLQRVSAFIIAVV